MRQTTGVPTYRAALATHGLDQLAGAGIPVCSAAGGGEREREASTTAGLDPLRPPTSSPSRYGGDGKDPVGVVAP